MIQTLFTGKLLKQAYFNFNVELKIHHSKFPVGLISVLFSENLWSVIRYIKHNVR